MFMTIIVLVAIAAFVFYVSQQPDTFHIERSATMTATPEKIFLHISDLHQWNEWSPWAKLDPNSRPTFEGTTTGIGAVMRWSGNKKVGAGAMRITESKPSHRIVIRLDFLRPMKATHVATFTLTPQGDQTNVTWAMTGNNQFIGKLIGLVMKCDKMIGGQFEQGLSSLKGIVEA